MRQREKAVNLMLVFIAGIALAIVVFGSLPPLAYGKDVQQEYLSALALRDGLDIFTPTTNLSARYFPVETNNFPHPNPHPPLLSLLAMPLTLLPFPAIVLLLLALNVVALLTIGRWLGLSTQASLALSAWPPIWYTLFIGQYEILILAMLMLGWRLASEEQDTRAGMWLGIAAIMKFYPALLLLPFLARGRFRLVFVAGAVFLAGQIGNLLTVGPAGLMRYFAQVLPEVSGKYVQMGLNSAPYGALLRLFGGATDATPVFNRPEAALPIAIILSIGALVALAILRPEAGPVALLVAMPSAWSYYTVLALPLVVDLMRHRETRYWAIAATVGASYVLPLVNMTMETTMAFVHRASGTAPPIASVLAAIQPAGHLWLLSLAAITAVLAWRGFPLSRATWAQSVDQDAHSHHAQNGGVG